MKSLLLTKKESQQITTTQIANKLLTILERCHGKHNAMNKEKLFVKLFGHSYGEDALKDYVRWDFTRKAMNFLRRNSNRFVVSVKENDTRAYFVATKDFEIKPYLQAMKRTKERCTAAEARAQRAIKNKWHTYDVQLHFREPKQVN